MIEYQLDYVVGGLTAKQIEELEDFLTLKVEEMEGNIAGHYALLKEVDYAQLEDELLDILTQQDAIDAKKLEAM